KSVDRAGVPLSRWHRSLLSRVPWGDSRRKTTADSFVSSFPKGHRAIQVRHPRARSLRCSVEWPTAESLGLVDPARVFTPQSKSRGNCSMAMPGCNWLVIYRLTLAAYLNPF